MADYGGRGGGQSLRDALNQLYPMTGLGEYGAMFPPASGADQPAPAIPLPQPRPPMPQGLPPGVMGAPQGVPPQLPPGLQGGVPPQGGPLPTARPLGLGQPQSYTQRLGLGG